MIQCQLINKQSFLQKQSQIKYQFLGNPEVFTESHQNFIRVNCFQRVNSKIHMKILAHATALGIFQWTPQRGDIFGENMERARE